MRILMYLKGSLRQGLHFKTAEDRFIIIFTDADCVGSRIHKRSTTWYFIYVWRNLITWRSKKQIVVARSSSEVELRALGLGVCEGLWLKKVLSELGQTLGKSIQVDCGNISALHHGWKLRSTRQVQTYGNQQTFHVRKDRSQICQYRVDSYEGLFSWSPHQNSPHQIFFQTLLSKLGCITIYIQAWGGVRIIRQERKES